MSNRSKLLVRLAQGAGASKTCLQQPLNVNNSASTRKPVGSGSQRPKFPSLQGTSRKPNDGDVNNNLESAKHMKKIYGNGHSQTVNDSGRNQVLNSEPGSHKVAPGVNCGSTKIQTVEPMTREKVMKITTATDDRETNNHEEAVKVMNDKEIGSNLEPASDLDKIYSNENLRHTFDDSENQVLFSEPSSHEVPYGVNCGSTVSSFIPSEIGVLNPEWLKQHDLFIDVDKTSNKSVPAFPSVKSISRVEKVKQWLFKSPNKDNAGLQESPPTKNVAELVVQQITPVLNVPAVPFRKPDKCNVPHNIENQTPKENSNKGKKTYVTAARRKELFPTKTNVPMIPLDPDLMDHQPDVADVEEPPPLSNLDICPLETAPSEVIIETVEAWADGESADVVMEPMEIAEVEIQCETFEPEQAEGIVVRPEAEITEQMEEITEQHNAEVSDEIHVDRNGNNQRARKRNSVIPDHTPTKKRKVNHSQWKAAQNKKAVNTGKEYVNKQGKQIKARTLKPGCGSKCKLKCEEAFPDEKRQELFNKYWALGDKMLQWFFVAKLVKKVPIVRRRVTTEDDEDAFRKCNYQYSLGDASSEEKIVVCKTMFLNTFDISATVVRSALTKNSPDKRGKSQNSRRRIPEELVQGVIDHIKLFPVMKSHYCRVDTRKRYLDTHLNVAKMHRMYLSERPDGMPFTATLRQYRDIFNTSFNLGFFKPKKDRCADCVEWESLPEDQQAGAKLEKHTTHLQNKELVRQMRRDDKTLSRETDKTMAVATFDMQSVFFCPKTEISGAFYKSKISCYNFTVFDCTDKDAVCFVWDLSVGGKGADEIASFMFQWIETQVGKGKKVFHFYSDSCGPQNKNQFLYSMYYLAVMRFNITICHRYLVRGHTQMECDSVHARIEKKTKKEEVFTPGQWHGLIKSAKVKQPLYKVFEVKRENIYTFRTLAKHFTWATLNVSKIREITMSSSTPGKALLKKDLNMDPLEVTVLLPRPGRPINWSTYKLEIAYQGRLALKENIKKSLKWFVKNKKIPEVHLPFYESLLAPAPVEVEGPESEDEEEEPQVTNTEVFENEGDEDDPALLIVEEESEGEEDGQTTDSEAYD